MAFLQYFTCYYYTEIFLVVFVEIAVSFAFSTAQGTYYVKNSGASPLGKYPLQILTEILS
jgi:hypothetical protein